MPKVIDMAGVRYSRLLALAPAGYSDRGERLWSFICDCGNEAIKIGALVRKGHTKSCGCWGQEVKDNMQFVKLSHGKRHSREYEIWSGMLKRCLNPKTLAFVNYGGRGISVCDKWKTFEGFYEDMGKCPNGKQLDRVDNNGNYEKDNCRWATVAENVRNRRITKVLDFNGSKKSLAEWAEETGLGYSRLAQRIWTLGWSVEKALTTPAMSRAGNHAVLRIVV